MKNIRFLVVDDSSTMRTMIHKYLTRIGANHIVQAENGKDALALMFSDEIDFIITDWNMPELDGIHLIKAIRQVDDFKHIPILMVTTRGSKQDIIEALKVGTDNYIVKPFDALVLKDKIDDMLLHKK